MRTKNICLYFLVICLLISCAPVRPSRECTLESMLLTQDDFPSDTIVNKISSPIAEMSRESAGFTARYGDSLMYHEINRYLSSDDAKEIFQEGRDIHFRTTEYYGPWETPTELSYVSPIAQQYYVACGKVDEKYQCRMIGQYEEYYVFFFAYISDNGVTFDILNDLLQKIDERMEQCLKE